MPLRLVVAEDYDDMSARAASLVKEALARRAVDGAPARPARLTVPTGDTPLGLYERLAADPAAAAALRAADIYQLDEYLGAGPGDDVSFAGWLRRALLRPAGIPDGRFHRLPADHLEPQLALAHFEAELAAAGGLDLAVLGLGVNGHLGFNEPGSPFDAPARIVRLRPETVRVNRHYWKDAGEDTPHYGVTLGLRTLFAARRVILLASGEHKAAALARALEGPVTPDVPASGLRRARGEVIVVADRAAASRLADVPAPSPGSRVP
ncbi:MAG: glucosamine-6-phosphate deaminase [Clostridia bacterium]|nr:glucosamine-6-phosphate deaminase [Clostridia bacterium]